jgi:hypothetical protein
MALADYLPTLTEMAANGVQTAATAHDQLAALVIRGTTLANALDAVERGRQQRLPVSREAVLGLAHDLSTFVDTYYADVAYPPDLFLEVRLATLGCYQLTVYRRGFAVTPGAGNTDTTDMLAPQLDGRPLIPYVVREGDTVERMALSYLGDVARAWEILELNDLAYPFFLTHGEADPPKIARPGDLIWLPPDAIVPDADATPSDVELYGRDFALPDGRLRFWTSGEAAPIEGKDNVVQALLQRLATGQGSMVLHPEYGIRSPLVIGVEGTPERVRFNGMEAARTCRQDPRVSRVAQVHIAFADTINTIDLRLVLIGPASHEVPLNLVMPEGGP